MTMMLLAKRQKDCLRPQPGELGSVHGHHYLLLPVAASRPVSVYLYDRTCLGFSLPPHSSRCPPPDAIATQFHYRCAKIEKSRGSRRVVTHAITPRARETTTSTHRK